MRRRIKPGTRPISLSTRTMRRILSWKFVFYELLLPVLRGLGPARGDAILGFLGWLAMVVRPRGAIRMRAALERASTALDADWSIETTWPALAANTARFLARDYPARPPDRRSGPQPVRRSRLRTPSRHACLKAEARSWLAATWEHTSREFTGCFAAASRFDCSYSGPGTSRASSITGSTPAGIHPQAEMFLRRDLSPAVAVERVFRARSALRDGLAIYLNGDIPWSGPNTCSGHAAGPPPAPAGHLDRTGGSHRHAGLSRVLHPSARRPIRTRDRSHRPPSARRRRNRRRRLPQAARSPHRDLPGRCRRPSLWPCYESPSVPQKHVRTRKVVGSRQSVDRDRIEPGSLH